MAKRNKAKKANKRSNRAKPVFLKNMRNGPVLGTSLGESLVDPWSKSSCIPDGATGVGCFSTKAELSLATGAGGSACGLICQPDTRSFYYIDTGSVNATATVAGAWTSTSSSGSIQTLYQSFRRVSCGMRGVYVGNTSTDGGSILVGLLPANFAINVLNGANITTAAGYMRTYKILPLRGGFSVTWTPEDMQDLMAFSPTAGGGNVVATAQGQVLCAALVFGAAAATTVLQVELVANYEGMFNNQNFIPGGTSDRPQVAPEPGWYERAIAFKDKFDSIAPLFGSAVSGFATGGVFGAVSNVAARIMGNGYQYPLVAAESFRDRKRPQLQYPGY